MFLKQILLIFKSFIFSIFRATTSTITLFYVPTTSKTFNWLNSSLLYWFHHKKTKDIWKHLKNTNFKKSKFFAAQLSNKKKFSKKKKNIFRVIRPCSFWKFYYFWKILKKKFFFFTFWSNFERLSRSTWSVTYTFYPWNW